mgnify:CR=1 FL=1
MRDYTYQEMVKMQEEAVRRVREMKKRSAFAAEDAQSTLNPDRYEEDRRIFTDSNGVKRISFPVEYDKRHGDFPSDENRQEMETPVCKGLADYIRDDPDALLIMSVIVLLSEEKADPALLSALAYMLL